MQMRYKILLAITWWFGASLATAGDQNDASLKAPVVKTPNLNGQQLQDPYGGVVLDQTVTGFGHAFYQYFVSFWRDEPLSDRYSISVHERATARFGSQVWVEYAQRRMFQAFLPPSNTAIRATSEKAVALVYSNVVEADVLRLLFRDADIGPDEL